MKQQIWYEQEITSLKRQLLRARKQLQLMSGHEQDGGDDIERNYY